MNKNNLIENRRNLHKIPELLWQEVETTKFIYDKLKSLKNIKIYGGLQLQQNSHPINSDFEIKENATGLVVEYGEAPFFLIRADIDALPIKEEESNDHYPFIKGFNSTNNNMHACGHDGHAALLIELIKTISENNIDASFRFLFQPAEENVKGAIRLGDWIMQNVYKMIGYHIGLGQEQNTIGVGSTSFLGVRKILLDFYGKSAHACNSPEEGINVLPIFMSYYNLANEMLKDSRCRNIINFGTIKGGNSINAVMDHISVGMDVRSFTDELLNEIVCKLENLAHNLAKINGASASFVIDGSAQCYYENDHDSVNEISKILNDNNIETTLFPKFGASEDVTLIMQKVKQFNPEAKTIHLLLGTDLKGPHHDKTFDFPEDDLIFFYNALEKIILNWQ